MFALKKFKQCKQNNYNKNRKLVKQRISDYYAKQELLCKKCKLCSLSLDDIKENYDDILERITIKEK